jgi:hypothetical protein
MNASFDFDTRTIDFLFDAASSAFEAASVIPGFGPFGGNDPFSIGMLGLTNDSLVSFTNDFINQSIEESVFASSFSIDSSSHPDINGIDFWVNGNVESSLDSDILRGLIVDSTLGAGSFLDAQFMPNFNATVVIASRVPEPPALFLFSTGLVVFGVVLRRWFLIENS